MMAVGDLGRIGGAIERGGQIWCNEKLGKSRNLKLQTNKIGDKTRARVAVHRLGSPESGPHRAAQPVAVIEAIR
jgi:hypothetical protein